MITEYIGHKVYCDVVGYGIETTKVPYVIKGIELVSLQLSVEDFNLTEDDVELEFEF